MTKHLSLSLC